MIPQEIIDKINDNVDDLLFIDHSNFLYPVLDELDAYHSKIKDLEWEVYTGNLRKYRKDYKTIYEKIDYTKYNPKNPYCGYCNYCYDDFTGCHCTEYCLECKSFYPDVHNCKCEDPKTLGRVYRDGSNIYHLGLFPGPPFKCGIKQMFIEEYLNQKK